MPFRACRIVIADPYVGGDYFISKIEEKLNSRCIDFGTAIRQEYKAGSELGLRIKAVTDKGEVMSDEMIKELFVGELKKDASGIVIKNFPRTPSHLKILQECFIELTIEVVKVWYLKLSYPERLAESEFKKSPEYNAKSEITLESIKGKIQRTTTGNQTILPLLQKEYNTDVIEVDINQQSSLLDYYNSIIE